MLEYYNFYVFRKFLKQEVYTVFILSVKNNSYLYPQIEEIPQGVDI